MNRELKDKARRDRTQRRDWVRFEVKDTEVHHQGETVEEFLARGGQVKKVAAGTAEGGRL